jgi:quinohemoprotein ethanol dehydrogenase
LRSSLAEVRPLAGACLTAALLVFVLFALLVSPVSHASASLAAGMDWSAPSGDTDETDYSRLDEIRVDNVGKLGLAWMLDLPGEVSLEATPLAVGGVLYFTGSYGKVYAAEGATGKLLWTYDPEIWAHHPERMRLSFGVNRGVAYSKGRVFSATLDGRLLALEAGSGKLLWEVATLAPASMQYITGAPRALHDKVIIGQAGADFGARGYLTAYDAATGRQLWRFYTAPGSPEQNRGDPAMERAAATWSGEYWKTGTGGGPWNALTFDTKLNRIYLGTANAGPEDPSVRSPGGGDNLYTASIVALDADTGRYLWHYQINPRDAWDYDCTEQMTLAQLIIDGKPRDVLMQAPKNGFFYLIDRHTGKLISAEKIGKVTWAERIDLTTGRPVETPGSRYETGETVVWPNPTGAHSWQAWSFSSKTGLVYIPYMQNGVHFYRGAAKPWDVSIGGLSIGSYKADPEDGTGALLAWDPVAQQARWKVHHDFIFNGGLLSTAGNLVFQGTADGYITAYDAANGGRLWSFNAGLGVIAAPMTYGVHGRQYVAVLVGWGGASGIGNDVMNVGWKWGAPRRLLAFAIGGTVTLPPSPSRTLAVHPVDDPNVQLELADVEAGKQLYMNCILCHGRELVGAGAPAPDLRESRVALDPNALWKVVHEGALMNQGMPRFETLTRAQVDQLYTYIRSSARKALP